MDLPDRKITPAGVVPRSEAGIEDVRDSGPRTTTTAISPKLGRPRSQTTRKAIMRAVLSMLKREDYADISIEQIAAKAKVSKHSIYRWWNSKGEVVLDAFLEYALQKVPQADLSNDAFTDLEGFVESAYRMWHDPLFEKGLRGLVIEMSFDPGLRQKFNDVYLTPRKQHLGNILKHGVDRGQLRANLDIEAVVDVIFGFVWFHISFNATSRDERRTARRLITLLRLSLEIRPSPDALSLPKRREHVLR